MLTPTIVEIRNTAPPVTYVPFTDTMLRCVGRNNKIACVKLWREVNRVSPVAWDKNGKPAIPGLRSAKKVVEAAMREWDAQEDYARPASPTPVELTRTTTSTAFLTTREKQNTIPSQGRS